ncbi:MAG TPA: hypothetical protein VLH17_04000 [Candidatus Binatia bacterium]|nr:hypothetical protein [Candidatus Binatia bacterium]
MSDLIFLDTEESPAGNPSGAGAQSKNGSAGCSMQGKGWFKGALGMAICCAAPILLFAAISFFGLSLGAIASETLSLVVLLACPVGMFLMMRVMIREKQGDQTSRK